MEKRDRFEIPQPLERALAIIAGASASSAAKWLIGGSTGLQLRGLRLAAPPRDLDLYADEEAAKIIHEALRPYAVDEQQLSMSPIYRSFLSHYDIHGVQVELVGGFIVTSGADRYAVEVEEVLEPLRMQIGVGQYYAGIVPLAHELCFNVLRARWDRVDVICSAMAQELDLHREALAIIATRNHFSAALQEVLYRRLTMK